jgi:predicted nucleic acid-binding protein
MSDAGEKPSLYLETTIVSYLAGRPARDLLLLAHQESTRQWWEHRDAFRLYASQFVLDEAQRGDPGAAARRLELLRDAVILDATDELADLAEDLAAALDLPPKGRADAVHLAFAIYYRLDYLLTWNCAHLANAPTLRKLSVFALNSRLWYPIVCTPDEMPWRPEEDDHVH